ncbi:MAG: formylglycine-generating enzyme family protein [Treponema sp.]|nr:formylglycine-generating enzyme family protein [Treponema sp.]
MRRVPAGSFLLKPGKTAVITKPFLVSETQITQEQFMAVMGANPSNLDGSPGKEADPGEVQGRRPVEMVPWYAAIAFCNKLSLRNGKQPVYSVKVNGKEVDWKNIEYFDIPASRQVHENDPEWDKAVMDREKNGYRLPTEMEWMWACLGADETNREWRKEDDERWLNFNSNDKTHEVGLKKPNALGIFDMGGNVWEWCWDLFSDNYPDGVFKDHEGGYLYRPHPRDTLTRIAQGRWYRADFFKDKIRPAGGSAPRNLHGYGFRIAANAR